MVEGKRASSSICSLTLESKKRAISWHSLKKRWMERKEYYYVA